ncbi:hypothetical protein PROCOU_03799 [Listeria rocourtiae FSL F6-920]|nr:hypothetical protein PROCOU_03799 [Listeria rocourtiae FSL F6-920]
MRKFPIWFYILAIFAVIGIFFVGFKSIISSLVVSIILVLLIWLLFRFLGNRPKKGDKYQSAVKQSQKLRAQKRPQTKKTKNFLESH